MSVNLQCWTCPRGKYAGKLGRQWRSENVPAMIAGNVPPRWHRNTPLPERHITHLYLNVITLTFTWTTQNTPLPQQHTPVKHSVYSFLLFWHIAVTHAVSRRSVAQPATNLPWGCTHETSRPTERERRSWQGYQTVEVLLSLAIRAVLANQNSSGWSLRPSVSSTGQSESTSVARRHGSVASTSCLFSCR